MPRRKSKPPRLFFAHGATACLMGGLVLFLQAASGLGQPVIGRVATTVFAPSAICENGTPCRGRWLSVEVHRERRGRALLLLDRPLSQIEEEYDAVELLVMDDVDVQGLVGVLDRLATRDIDVVVRTGVVW